MGGPSQQDRWHYLAITVGVAAVWVVLFNACGHYAAGLSTFDPTTAWDRALPFVPEFVWAYQLVYLSPLLPWVLGRDWHRFNQALVAFIFANLSAFIVYLLFPLAFPIPELGGSVSERLLQADNDLDFRPGANKLPSQHVATAVIVYFACVTERSARWERLAWLSWPLLIAVSTLMVRKHVLIDVVAGLVWGLATWQFAVSAYARLVPAGTAPREALWRVLMGTARLHLVLLAASAIIVVIQLTTGAR